jgi:allophanate hydrolase subunit 1
VVAGTPCNICDYSKEQPFLVNAGDWVKYQPVSRKDYDLIRADVERGTYKLETYVKKAVK